MADQLSEAQQGGGAMVVGVEEGQLLLFHHQEHGIDELGEFSQVVQVVEGDQFLGPSVRAADGVEQAMVVDDGEQLFNHQHEQSQGQSGEEQVVELEQTIQYQRSQPKFLPHEVATENDGVVNSDGNQYRREG